MTRHSSGIINTRYIIRRRLRVAFCKKQSGAGKTQGKHAQMNGDGKHAINGEQYIILLAIDVIRIQHTFVVK